MSKKTPEQEEEEITLEQIRGLRDYLPEEDSTPVDDAVSKQRQGAREKLTKLSKQQFKELSTDVYDEMRRRVECMGKTAPEQTPFLAVREDFHPKRNQTRQKLATLPETRYGDLASDVFFELCRRYPIQKGVVYESPKKVLTGGANSHPASAPAAAAPSSTPAQPPATAGKPVPSAAAQKMAAAVMGAPLPPPILPSAVLVLPPVAEVKKERKQAPEKPQKDAAPAATSLPVVTEVDIEFSSINFESLDSLMADLGNMITTAPKKDTPQSPETAQSQKKPALAALEIPDIVEPPALSTEEYIESARKSFISAPGMMEVLKSQHNEEIASLKQYHTQKEAKLQEEHKQVVSQYESRLANLETQLREAQNKTQTTTTEEYNALLKDKEESAKQVTALELALRQEGDKGRDLQSQLADEREAKKQSDSKLLKVQSENLELTSKINTLMEDLTSRLRSKDAELSSRLREIRELVDVKNGIEMDRNEIQVENIALKEENRTLKEALKNAHHDHSKEGYNTQRKLARQPTSTALQVSITEELVFNEGESMKDLSKGVQELITASEESNPTKILTAMKAVVMTVRRHLDDAEEYEKGAGASLPPAQKEKFNGMQNDISDKLTALVMVAKAHASGKAEGTHAEVLGRIESLSTNLSNVVVRLLGGMMVKHTKTKEKELEVDDLPDFLDKQTNVIVQAIQTLLVVIKNPATATSDYLSAIDSLVGAVTILKNVSSHSVHKRGASVDTARAEYLLRGLSDGITKLLGIRESVSSGEARPPNQTMAAAAFELAKITKEVVTVLS